MARRRATDALTLRGRALLATGCALTVCGVLLGFRDITRVGLLVAALPVAALLLARRPLTLATSRTVTPPMVAPDERSDVLLEVRNTGIRTTPMVMAEEQVDYALGDRPRFVIPRMDPGTRHQVNYAVRGTVRGRHRLGPLGLRVKDPFDLTLRLAVVRDVGELIVLPTVVPLGDVDVTGAMGREGTVPHMIALHGEDDVSVREWREGDDLRRIHWPATAHTGDLMVRQEDRPATRRVVLLLDDRDRLASGDRSPGSFEWAVTAVASIAAQVVDSGTSVHLVCAGRSHSGHSPAEPLTLDEALLTLAVAEMEPPSGFQASLERVGEAASTGAVCIAVVMPMDERDAERLARTRAVGAAAIALVLSDGAGRGSAGGSDAGSAAQLTATRLRERGWIAVPVPVGTSVAAAWAAARTSSRSGAVR